MQLYKSSILKKISKSSLQRYNRQNNKTVRKLKTTPKDAKCLIRIEKAVAISWKHKCHLPESMTEIMNQSALSIKKRESFHIRNSRITVVIFLHSLIRQSLNWLHNISCQWIRLTKLGLWQRVIVFVLEQIKHLMKDFKGQISKSYN